MTYKQISQKYQIDDGTNPCKPTVCQQIPLKAYQKPRYGTQYPNAYPSPFTKEHYAANVNNDNTCSYFVCNKQSCKNFTSCNQKAPYYKLGPQPNICNPPTYIYSMPNQQLVWGAERCNINTVKMPWYGLP